MGRVNLNYLFTEIVGRLGRPKCLIAAWVNIDCFENGKKSMPLCDVIILRKFRRHEYLVDLIDIPFANLPKKKLYLLTDPRTSILCSVFQ